MGGRARKPPWTKPKKFSKNSGRPCAVQGARSTSHQDQRALPEAVYLLINDARLANPIVQRALLVVKGCHYVAQIANEAAEEFRKEPSRGSPYPKVMPVGSTTLILQAIFPGVASYLPTKRIE